jgi:hypothetical protein
MQFKLMVVCFAALLMLFRSSAAFAQVDCSLTPADAACSSPQSPLTTTNRTLTTFSGVPLVATLQASGGTPPYRFSVVKMPDYGSLTGVAPNMTYISEARFVGQDRFRYRVTDAVGATSTGEMYLVVSAPFTMSAPATIYTRLDQAVEFAVDLIGGIPPYSLTITSSANGTVSAVLPTLTYTPVSGFVGSDSFTVTIADRMGTTVTKTIQAVISGNTIVPAGNTAALIAAIEAANASSTADTLLLSGTYILITPHNTTMDGANGLPIITSDLVIRGDATIQRVSSAEFRLFEVASGAPDTRRRREHAHPRRWFGKRKLLRRCDCQSWNAVSAENTAA